MASAANIHIAPLPQRERNINTSVGAYAKSLKPSDKAKWICVYPCYVNAKKSLAEGRKLRRDKCVDNPKCTEIRDVLGPSGAGFTVEYEPHRVHPRELNKFDDLYKG